MQYHYAAARLAVDHAERRMEETLAAFVHSLAMPTDARTPLAESLSARLALLRRGSARAIAPATASDHVPDETLNVRRAA